MIQLRDYQEEAVQAVEEYWAKQGWSNKPCLLQLATGAGKSLIIAELVKRIGPPVLVLQPTKEILEQNYQKLLDAGVPKTNICVCSASAGSWTIGQITLATIGTICQEHRLPYCSQFKAMIVDEADVVPNDRAVSQYMQFFNSFPQAKVVGLTATPWRNQTFAMRFQTPRTYCRPLTRIHCKGGEKEPRGQWFWGPVIYRCAIPDLQQRGFLSPTEYHVAETDWSFIVDKPGRVEYEMTQMTQWVEEEDNMSRFHQAIAWCRDNNYKTIVFTPNIDINFRLLSVIRGLGAKAECMDSDHDNKTDRAAKMAAFRRGDFQFLINVGMVGRGVDVPSVDAVVLCRPTKSLSFYMQAVGRCLRIDPNNPDKVAQILDLAGNVKRFGRVEDVVLDQEDAVSSNGWKFKKDVIKITRGNRKRVWDLVV